jgi:AcrR family transcriptional regulator
MRVRSGTRQSPRRRSGIPGQSPRLQRIVEELEKMFFAHGFLHFSTEELARRLRCSKQTLYVLAKSREELFGLIIERLFSGIRAEADQAAREVSDRIAALTACLEAIRKAASKVNLRFAQDLSEFPQGQRRLREHEAKLVSTLATIIASGTRDGVFREVHPRLAAAVMIQGATRIVDPTFLAEAGLTLQQAFAEFHVLCMNGLIKPAGAEPDEKERNDDALRRRGANLIAFR